MRDSSNPDTEALIMFSGRTQQSQVKSGFLKAYLAWQLDKLRPKARNAIQPN